MRILNLNIPLNHIAFIVISTYYINYKKKCYTVKQPRIGNRLYFSRISHFNIKQR